VSATVDFAIPKHIPIAVWLVAIALIAVACSGGDGQTSGSADATGSQELVEPDPTLPEVVVNVSLTDTGIEPQTVYLPAGRHVKLILRNRGTGEHHYRIAGLIPGDLGWFMAPELDEYDLESMTPEELESYGISGDIDDKEHVLHHLTPMFMAFKEESRAGIKPLPNEVHGYAYPGQLDVVTFFALSIGRYVAEDVLHPEFQASVVVYDSDSG